MRLPRPSSPRALWADTKAFLGDRPRQHWIALGLALVIPAIIFVIFMFDMRNAQEVKPDIIYADSWKADRSLEETQANINAIGARNRAFREQRRREFQKIDDALKNHGL